MLDEASRQVKTEAGLALTLECLKSVEILMTSPNLAPANGPDNRPEQLLVFLIPVLIGHLMESVKVTHRSFYCVMNLFGRYGLFHKPD